MSTINRLQGGITETVDEPMTRPSKPRQEVCYGTGIH